MELIFVDLELLGCTEHCPREHGTTTGEHPAAFDGSWISRETTCPGVGIKALLLYQADKFQFLINIEVTGT